MSDVTIWLTMCEGCGAWFATADPGQSVCPTCEKGTQAMSTTTITIVERECLGCGTLETAATVPAGAKRHRLTVFDCDRCRVVERFELVEVGTVTR